MIFFARNIPGFFKNVFLVLLGMKSWVGYYYNEEATKLPSIREGILNPTDAFPKKELDNEMKTRLNMIYARDYSIMNDLNILIKGLREVGRRV